MANPSIKMLKNPIHAMSLGFGMGLLPKAPGTWGTLVAYPFYLIMMPLGKIWYGIILFLLIVFSCYACGFTADALGEHDHKSIVFDEVVGYLLVLMFTPVSLTGLLLSFIFFRLFDIFKPWPISWFDQNLKNGIGIVVDDLLAAIYAVLVILLVTPLLASL